jgi:branched-chain amino acid transport system permease protein
VIGAVIAGSVGAYYAHYSTVVCPSDLSNYMTTILVIVLFLGGVGRMRGVILGSIIFTFLPEFLRIAATWRMVIYGVLLLVTIVYMPEGLDGAFTKVPGKISSLVDRVGNHHAERT